MPGLQFIPAIGVQELSSAALSHSALSLLDFNIFRGNVQNAINILDQKLRDILAVQEPTCV